MTPTLAATVLLVAAETLGVVAGFTGRPRIVVKTWDLIATAVRPIMAPLVAPLERMEDRRIRGDALADLDITNQLDRVGLSDSAERLRDSAVKRIAGNGHR
jgi:hypothetical protein